VLVNVIFDKDNNDFDVIDIPQTIMEDIADIQQMFFKWLFDKKNNHKYWICVDDMKKYCSYRAEAFVEWLNNYYFLDSSERARCLIICGTDIDESRPYLFF